MAGLWGDDPDERRQNIGLLALLAGGNMMAANGPGVTTGQALGSGLAAGAHGMQQMQVQRLRAQQLAQQAAALKSQEALRMMQMKKTEQEIAQQNQWAALFGGGADTQRTGITSPSSPEGGIGAGVPQTGMSLPAGVDPRIIAAMGPEAGAKWLAGQSAKADQWQPVPGTGLQVNVKTGEQKPISPKLVDLAVNPNINMPPMQTKEQEFTGKYYGELNATLQSAAMKATQNNNQLDRLGTLLDQAYTGVGAEQVLAAQRAAKVLNIDLGNPGPGEAANALASQMALELRNPVGGAGMPGAMSDADRAFLMGMTPGIAKTPEGRASIIETYKLMNKRSIDVAKLAREFKKKNGTLEGFEEELANWSEKNPLFAGMAAKQPASIEYDYVPGKGLVPRTR